MIVAAIPEKRLYTEDEAGIYLGYPAVFERCKKAGWITRADAKHVFKMPVYDREDLDACVNRLKAGDVPE